MSDTDGFIEEVTEEVRRDRLYGLLRRYGWIGALIILGIVGGTAWQAWQRDQAENRAQAFGDSLLAALENNSDAARAAQLTTVEAQGGTAAIVRDFLLADALIRTEETADAIATFKAIENNADVPMIYRQMASFKALSAGQEVLSVDERRSGFDLLATPGNPFRALAEEQLALIDVETGNRDGALERLCGASECRRRDAGLATARASGDCGAGRRSRGCLDAAKRQLNEIRARGSWGKT